MIPKLRIIYMHFFFLWFPLFFVAPVKADLPTMADTCKLIEVKISKPLREITNYKSYYKQFEDNDTSDYQLIAISIPYDDSYGHLVYYNVTDSTSISQVGTTIDMREKRFDKPRTEIFKGQLNEIRKSGYACICDLNSSKITYSICMIKKKGDVIFQYQGINKNLLNLDKSEGGKIEAVIKLIKILRE